MLKTLARWFRKVEDKFTPTPALDCVPDQTHKGLTIPYWVTGLGENKEVPGIGDLVIELQSCSMGMTVSRDIRWRVIGRPFLIGASTVASVRAKNKTHPDETTFLSVFYMRRHATLPRVWFLIN
jgi:hypothetical protein